MAEFAHVAFGAGEPFRRLARIRRRVLTVHVVAAVTAFALMNSVIGADATTSVDWIVVVGVCVASLVELGGLLTWAWWTWQIRGVRPPPNVAWAGADRWERAALRDARGERTLGAAGRTVLVGCCWWLEWTVLAAGLVALSDPDAPIPDWSIANVVLPAVVLLIMGVVFVFVRLPARLLRNHRRPPRVILRDSARFRDYDDR